MQLFFGNSNSFFLKSAIFHEHQPSSKHFFLKNFQNLSAASLYTYGLTVRNSDIYPKQLEICFSLLRFQFLEVEVLPWDQLGLLEVIFWRKGFFNVVVD